MNKSNSQILRILKYAIPLLLTVLWLGFIFSNSLQDAEQSSEASSTVQEIVNEVAQSIGVKKPISITAIRKSSHFIEFAVLGALVCVDLMALGAVPTKKRSPRASLFFLPSIAICALFASVDEILQNFSEGRGPSVSDVLLDTSGAIAATLIFMLIYITVYAVQKKRSVKK